LKKKVIHMGKNPPQFETGQLLGRIPYLKIGHGPKKAVIFRESGELIISLAKDPTTQAKIFRNVVPADYTAYIFGYDQNLSAGYTEDRIATDFAAIIQKEIGKATIIGLSYGGLIALPFAARYPDLTDRLILLVTAHQISPGGVTLAKELVQIARNGDRYQLDQRFNDLFGTWWLRWLFKLISWKNWHISPQNYKSKLNDPNQFINAYETIIANNENRRQFLPQILAPTLIIGATRDQFFSQDLYRETAENIPHARLIMVEGTHTTVVEHLYKVKPLIYEFLTENEP
jgi:pimeloyl-ACP methyl ester carboxylesterase